MQVSLCSVDIRVSVNRMEITVKKWSKQFFLKGRMKSSDFAEKI